MQLKRTASARTVIADIQAAGVSTLTGIAKALPATWELRPPDRERA